MTSSADRRIHVAYDYPSDTWRVEVGAPDANGNLDWPDVHETRTGDEADAWTLARQLAAESGLTVVAP